MLLIVLEGGGGGGTLTLQVFVITKAVSNSVIKVRTQVLSLIFALHG